MDSNRFHDVNELLAIIFVARAEQEAQRQTFPTHCGVDFNTLSTFVAVEFHKLATFFESTRVLSTETTLRDTLPCK
jgi:hypothetical protein